MCHFRLKRLSEGKPVATALGAGLLPAWMSSDTTSSPDASSPDASLAPLNAPQCTPINKLKMTVTLPPFIVSMGNAAGDVYTVTVTNSGVLSTTEVSLRVDPSAGFFYVGNSATATSNISGALSFASDPGTTAPDASFVLPLAGPPPANALLAGESIVFTFKLGTNANAVSGKLLKVDLLSGDPTTKVCKSRSENVQTARGNLVVDKKPVVQEAEFGDEINWTVTLRNAGIGNVYNAYITDTIAAGYANVQMDTGATLIQAPGTVIQNGAVIPLLEREETISYGVTATVASCSNLVNEVETTWSIGNEDGTATAAMPYSATVDVVPDLNDPDVVVEIGSLPEILYCGEMNVTVPVTVTNNGGAAQQLRLLFSGQNVSVDTADPDWSFVGDTFTYSGGVIPGALLSGESDHFRHRSAD